MFEQAFKNVDDILWKESGCTTELDYTEQTSWLLFLKYLDALEQDKEAEANLEGKKYTFILDKSYRWEIWAAPKGKDGRLDHNKAKTGEDLCKFVNEELFPYLQGFKQKASGPNTIEYKIGEIFAEIKNKINSGYKGAVMTAKRKAKSTSEGAGPEKSIILSAVVQSAWKTRKLGELCKTGSGGTPLKSKKEYYEGGTIPWLLSGEVAQGEINHASNFITKRGLENSAAKIFPKDTVLIAMYEIS